MDPSTLVESLTAGPGLDLVPVEAAHAAPLFELVDRDRSRLGARLPWVAHTRTVADTLAFIEASTRRHHVDEGGDGGGDWLIVEASAGIVGVIGLHSVSWAHRRVGTGYWVSGDREGRGYVSRSVTAVADHLMRRGIHRVEIHAAVDNDRSRGVAERCGFQFEGVCRAAEWIDGRPIDHAIYGRLATGRATA